MSRYKREIILRRDSDGAVIPSATVLVYLAGTTNLATIYPTKTGLTPVSGSSLTTNSKGVYKYYVDDADYATFQLFKEVITATGYTAVTYDDIEITVAVFTDISTHAALQTGVHGISITAGKTLTASNSITLSGVDGKGLSVESDSVVNQDLSSDASPTFAALTITAGFGCNSKTPQTAYASGGALNTYGTGAYGLDSGANMAALHALVVKMRAALVANGIMS